jgi:hypothetical protein
MFQKFTPQLQMHALFLVFLVIAGMSTFVFLFIPVESVNGFSYEWDLQDVDVSQGVATSPNFTFNDANFNIVLKFTPPTLENVESLS